MVFQKISYRQIIDMDIDKYVDADIIGGDG